MESSCVNSKGKTLAKNTLFLYGRMMLSMLVSLYTSRVILYYLGVEDYGIYNVVGGIVSMFSIVSVTLSSSISRNLTFVLGKGDMDNLRRMFSSSIVIQLFLVGVVFLLGETVGLWFLNEKMIIPENRIIAANWVYQFSILTFSFGLLSVPYNASIISHERMNTFAYIGLFEILAKLVVVYMLSFSPIDKLTFYAFLLFCISVIVRIIYVRYCKSHFVECHFSFCYDSVILKEILSFAGWNFIGCTALIFKTHGLNILLNMFLGPAINAARAIATQVNNALSGFISNFMIALTPQITKAYAQNDTNYLLNCIYRGSKFSFFLLLLLSLPVLIETESLLLLWLKVVPDTTVLFIRYIIISSLSDTLSRTLIIANNATGDIKYYQIVIGAINLLVLPCAYVGLRCGMPAAETELFVALFIIVSIFPRIFFIKKYIPITYLGYLIKVIIPVVLVLIISVTLSFVIHNLRPEGTSWVLITCTGVFFISLISICLFGMTKDERYFVFLKLKNRLHMRRSKSF